MFNWEEVLTAVGPSGFQVTGRDDVVGGGSPSWFAHYTVVQQDGPKAPQFDVYRVFPWNQAIRVGTRPQYYIAGVNLDWGKLGDSNGKLYKWANDPVNILSQLIWPPYENNNTSVWSFDAAAQGVKDVDSWLQAWTQQIHSWAKEIDNNDSDWQGNAAGVFKALLNGFATELDKLHIELNTPSSPADAIEASRTQLSKATSDLYNAFGQWRNSQLAYPAACVAKVFDNVQVVSAYMNPERRSDPPTITTNYGDPTSKDFWDRVESEAKGLWKGNVASVLDPPADQIGTSLDSSYQKTVSRLSQAITPVQLVMPPTPPPTPPPPPSTGNGPADGYKNFADGLNNLGNGLGGFGDGLTKFGSNMNNALGGFGDGLTGFGSGLNKFGSNMNNALPPPITGATDLLKTGPTDLPITGAGLPITGAGLPITGMTGNPITGLSASPLAANQTVFDKNGNPVLGPNGQPITVPLGSTIRPDGTIVGPDGQPIFRAPQGSTLRNSPLPGMGSTELTVPPGSTVNSNGAVVDANGNPVLGPDGRPLVLQKGQTISPSGAVLNADGTPVTVTSQLAQDFARQQAQGLAFPNSTSALNSLLPSTGGLGLPGKVPVIGGGGTGGRIGSALGPALGSDGLPIPATTGFGARAARTGGDPFAVDAVAAETAAAARARNAIGPAEQIATESQMMSRAAAGGQPIMPPMGGTSGGPGGSGDRQRNTWLSEEEDTWGTDSKAPTAVIGR